MRQLTGGALWSEKVIFEKAMGLARGIDLFFGQEKKEEDR